MKALFECLGAKSEKRTSGWGVGGASSWATTVSAAEAARVKRVGVVRGGRWERERGKEREGLNLTEGKVKALELKVGRRFG